MTHALQKTFSIGETVAVEFKRCGNGIPPDTYETVCAFLNRFGGDIYFGVLDDGSVEGIPPSHAPSLVRELLVNLLIHREFTSSRRSRFVIEPGRLWTENPCRASRQGPITPANLEPDSKNPVIAAFFRTIGFADELGSGVRKLFKYSRPFAGSEPTLLEGDIFQTSLALSADWFVVDSPSNDGINNNVPKNDGTIPNVPVNISVNVPVNVPVKDKVLELVRQCPGINRRQLAKALEVDVKTIARTVNDLAGLLEHHGSPKTGGYHLVPSSSNPADLNSADNLPPREDFP